jgi:hypothetical protein
MKCTIFTKEEAKQARGIIFVSLQEQSNKRTNFQKSHILSLTIAAL